MYLFRRCSSTYLFVRPIYLVLFSISRVLGCLSTFFPVETSSVCWGPAPTGNGLTGMAARGTRSGTGLCARSLPKNRWHLLLFTSNMHAGRPTRDDTTYRCRICRHGLCRLNEACSPGGTLTRPRSTRTSQRVRGPGGVLGADDQAAKLVDTMVRALVD